MNKAILFKHYGLKYWDIPEGYLCPPIPGRADYIHYAADLLAEDNNDIHPKGSRIKCLDIGTGASLIYPLIGSIEYDWNFIGSDISTVALASSQKIIEQNKLDKKISLIHQKNPNKILGNIINKEDYIDISICNPPFYGSEVEAKKANSRKTRNLTNDKTSKGVLNFGGKKHELITKGGEQQFISDYIKESIVYKNQVLWFTTLVSSEKNLPALTDLLGESKIAESKIIEMKTGNKISRILAWTFFSEKKRSIWVKSRW